MNKRKKERKAFGTIAQYCRGCLHETITSVNQSINRCNLSDAPGGVILEPRTLPRSPSFFNLIDTTVKMVVHVRKYLERRLFHLYSEPLHHSLPCFSPFFTWDIPWARHWMFITPCAFTRLKKPKNSLFLRPSLSLSLLCSSIRRSSKILFPWSVLQKWVTEKCIFVIVQK